MKEAELLNIEINRAKAELAQAEQNFNYAADEDFKEIAIDEYLVKQKKLNVLLGRAKRLGVTAC